MPFTLFEAIAEETLRSRPEIHKPILYVDRKQSSKVGFFCDLVAGAAWQDALIEAPSVRGRFCFSERGHGNSL